MACAFGAGNSPGMSSTQTTEPARSVPAPRFCRTQPWMVAAGVACPARTVVSIPEQASTMTALRVIRLIRFTGTILAYIHYQGKPSVDTAILSVNVRGPLAAHLPEDEIADHISKNTPHRPVEGQKGQIGRAHV